MTENGMSQSCFSPCQGTGSRASNSPLVYPVLSAHGVRLNRPEHVFKMKTKLYSEITLNTWWLQTCKTHCVHKLSKVLPPFSMHSIARSTSFSPLFCGVFVLVVKWQNYWQHWHNPYIQCCDLTILTLRGEKKSLSFYTWKYLKTIILLFCKIV